MEWYSGIGLWNLWGREICIFSCCERVKHFLGLGHLCSCCWPLQKGRAWDGRSIVILKFDFVFDEKRFDLLCSVLNSLKPWLLWDWNMLCLEYLSVIGHNWFFTSIPRFIGNLLTLLCFPYWNGRSWGSPLRWWPLDRLKNLLREWWRIFDIGFC